MIEKTTLEHLYLREKYSASEIAHHLNLTFPKVLYWIRKHQIPVRSSSDRIYSKYNRKGDPFCPKENLDAEEKNLTFFALGLYWGEGSRKSKHTVKLANLDPRVLRIFIHFLRTIARVHEERLRLDVRVYREFDLDAAKQYWAGCLNLGSERIFVYPHTDLRSRMHRQWSRYGIATLSAHNVKLKTWLDNLLEQHISKILR